jgi:TRAP-type transport system small permease protein
MLHRIEAWVSRSAQRLAVLAAFGLLAIALSTTADVLLRYLAGAPIRGHTELVALSGAVVIAAFFPALIATRANVTIRLLGKLLGRRATRWLDLFGSLVTTAFMAILAWQFFLYAGSMTAGGEVTPFLRLAVGPFWWTVGVLSAAAALTGLVVLARDTVATWTR